MERKKEEEDWGSAKEGYEVRGGVVAELGGREQWQEKRRRARNE